jgi:hypothetical protein
LELVFTNNHPKWWNMKDIYRYLLNGGGWNYGILKPQLINLRSISHS